MSEPIHVTDESFKADVLESDLPVLVDFWAPWCGPCRTVGPILERIANERPDEIVIAKVNVDENPQIAGMFGIQSIPTMVFFADGKPVEGTVGAAPYEPLNDWISQLIERVGA